MSDDMGEPGASTDSTGNTRRRTSRSSEASSPVGSTLSIVLALVAVLAGFFILRAIVDDDDGGDGFTEQPSGDTTGGSTGESASPVTTVGGQPPATTTGVVADPTPDDATKTGAPVVVANSNGTGGSAGQFSKVLETAGYDIADPAAVDDSLADALETSRIYYTANDAVALDVAQTLAAEMGGVEVAVMPTPIPVAGGTLGNGTVLLMLGNDAAGKQLSDLTDGANATAPSAAAAATTTTAAP